MRPKVGFQPTASRTASPMGRGGKKLPIAGDCHRYWSLNQAPTTTIRAQTTPKISALAVNARSPFSAAGAEVAGSWAMEGGRVTAVRTDSSRMTSYRRAVCINHALDR
ncbi:MAG TPA: hypothetical protein DCS97_04125 [Planctomycetes bacterium]|nr:hypothetical protein [Planctomycetota bacterium]